MSTKLLGIVAAVLVSVVLRAETVTVDNVASLTSELGRLNRLSSPQDKDLGHVVRLEPGRYDVKGVEQ